MAEMRTRRATITAAVVSATAVLLAACDTDPDVTVRAPATREITTTTDAERVTPAGGGEQAPVADDGGADALQPSIGYSIEWQPLTGDVDAGTITVPLDYRDPDGDTIDLRVAIHRADEDERIGVLFANNGGPGAAASTIAMNAPGWFAPDLVDRFDIVSWDPRGTGRSVPADCIDDDEYDDFFATGDITPETEQEHDGLVEQAEEFAGRCIERVGSILPHLGTNNTARDMDAIRQALDVPQASYFGFSYGSELGGVWATLFPTTVRAAVFDGAVDPNADSVETTRLQYVGFEGALDTFLSECSDDDGCAFHNDGDAAAAFDELYDAVDRSPLDSSGERTPVNQGVMQTAVVQAMYSDLFWPRLAEALADAQDGDGNGLLALHDDYFQRSPDGSYSDLIESFQAISCADDPDRPTIGEADAEAERLDGAAPRLFPDPQGDYACTFFPASAEPRAEVTGVGAGPIVVIGTTGDAATPLVSSERMADALEDGRLVVVEANQHTGYGVNGCVLDVVHEYLIQLVPPDDGTVCD